MKNKVRRSRRECQLNTYGLDGQPMIWEPKSVPAVRQMPTAALRGPSKLAAQSSSAHARGLEQPVADAIAGEKRIADREQTNKRLAAAKIRAGSPAP